MMPVSRSDWPSDEFGTKISASECLVTTLSSDGRRNTELNRGDGLRVPRTMQQAPRPCLQQAPRPCMQQAQRPFIRRVLRRTQKHRLSITSVLEDR